MRTKLLMFTVVLPLVCVVFAAVPGRADAISDILTVRNPAGVAVQVLTASESQETGGNQLFFIGVASLADPAQFGNPTVLCQGTTPCDATSPRSSFSDIVGVIQATIGGHTFSFIGFASDDESGLGAGAETPFGGLGSNFVLELPGVPIDVTKYLNPTLQAAGWTATFQSDPISLIPEPASLVLLGTGLLGLAGFSRRFMR